MTSVIPHSMAWTNERLKFSSADNVGLKALWKMLVFDNTNGKEVILPLLTVCTRHTTRPRIQKPFFMIIYKNMRH